MEREGKPSQTSTKNVEKPKEILEVFLRRTGKRTCYGMMDMDTHFSARKKLIRR